MPTNQDRITEQDVLLKDAYKQLQDIMTYYNTQLSGDQYALQIFSNQYRNEGDYASQEQKKNTDLTAKETAENTFITTYLGPITQLDIYRQTMNTKLRSMSQKNETEKQAFIQSWFQELMPNGTTDDFNNFKNAIRAVISTRNAYAQTLLDLKHTEGNLVGIYKNNGEIGTATIIRTTTYTEDGTTYTDKFGEKRKVNENLLGLAYVSADVLKSSTPALDFLLGEAIGIGNGLLGDAVIARLNSAREKYAEIKAVIQSAGATLSSAESQLIESKAKLIESNLVKLLEDSGISANLGSLSSNELTTLDRLSEIGTLLSIIPVAGIPGIVIKAVTTGISLGTAVYESYKSSVNGIVTLSQFLQSGGSQYSNGMTGCNVNKPGTPIIYDMSKYGLDNVVADSTVRNDVAGNINDNVIKAIDGIDNHLSGGGGNDVIFGWSKKDIIDGGAGNDVMYGGKGNDTLTGGTGNDTYVFQRDDGEDKVNEVQEAKRVQGNRLQVNEDKLIINGDISTVTFELVPGVVRPKNFKIFCGTGVVTVNDNVEMIAFSNGKTYDLLSMLESFKTQNSVFEPVPVTSGRYYINQQKLSKFSYEFRDRYRIIPSGAPRASVMNSMDATASEESVVSDLNTSSTINYTDENTGGIYPEGSYGAAGSTMEDLYVGDGGQNNYTFQSGQGKMNILDSMGYNGTGTYGYDLLKMEGTKAGNLKFEIDDSDGSMHIKDVKNADEVVILSYNRDYGQIEALQTDDVSGHLTTLENRISDYTNEILVGTESGETINGETGNDVIYGQGGNDTIYGGDGSDKFVFNGDFGTDIVFDDTNSPGRTNDKNKVYFSDLNFNDAIFSRADKDLIVTDKNNGSRTVNFKGFYNGKTGNGMISEFHFADVVKVHSGAESFLEGIIGWKNVNPTDPNPNPNPTPNPNPVVKITLDGRELEFGALDATITQSHTLVPLRGFIDEINETIGWRMVSEPDWNDFTNTVTIKELDRSGAVIQTNTYTIGSTQGTNNGTAIPLDVAPQIVNGLSMVPITYLAKIFDLDINWDVPNSCVILKTTDATIPGGINTPVDPGQPSLGSNSDVTLVLDGVENNLLLKAYTLNGHVMIPLRAICEALGATVSYNLDYDIATITENGQQNIIYGDGRMEARLNGQLVPIPVAVKRDAAGNMFIAAETVAAIFDKKLTYDSTRFVLTLIDPPTGIDPGTGWTPINPGPPGPSDGRIDGTQDPDTFNGTSGSDYYRGQNGGDTIYGNGGDDHLYGEDGADTIYAGDGDDYLSGGEGNDILYGNEGDDDIYGHDGGGSMYGDEGDDRIIGGTGEDIIWGGAGQDELDGGAGNDIIRGFINGSFNGTDRWNVIRGNTGNDTLYGGDWGNSYQYLRGDGTDTIQLADVVEHDDRLVFDGYSKAEAQFSIVGENLVISLAQAGDQITFIGWVKQTSRVEIYFSDGTLNRVDINKMLFEKTGTEGDDILTAAEGTHAVHMMGLSGNDTLTGNAGNNFMEGELGEDTLNGGLGDDGLYGGDGNDLLNGDEGNDVLFGGFGEDTLSGGAGQDMLYGEAGADILQGGENNDWLDGGYGNDLLEGGLGDDTLDGSKGDDVLVGGAGANTYVFGEGYGTDRTQSTSSLDTLHIKGGFTANDVNMAFFGDDLIITLRNGSDAIVVEGWKLGKTLAVITFDNGDAILGAQVAEQVNIYNGSDNADSITAHGDSAATLFGNDGNDVLYGADGNDSLFGGSSNDMLAGGNGNDRLDGGAGENVYVYRIGEGQDEITLNGNADTLNLGDGLTLDCLVTAFNGNNLEISFTNQPGKIVIKDWISVTNKVDGNKLAAITFADGNVIDTAAIEGLALTLRGTSGTDILTTPNYKGYTLDGGSGDDTLNGNVGNDTLIGGSGNDSLTGGSGNDTFIFRKGDGVDVVVSENNHPSGDVETLWFSDIAQGDAHFGVDENNPSNLVVESTDGTMRVIVEAYFGSASEFMRFRFGDAEALNLQESKALGRSPFALGTDANDTMFGNTLSDHFEGGGGVDVLKGKGGKDFIRGDSGSDIIAGGAGEDNIGGGTGVNTYLYNAGDGTDHYTLDSSVDVLSLGAGIAKADLHAAIDGSGNYVLQIGASGDVLTFSGWSTGKKLGHVELADGTVLNTLQLDALAGVTDPAAPPAGASAVTLKVDGVVINTSLLSFDRSGKVMVPLKALCEALGGNIGYDATTGAVSVLENGQMNTVYLDGRTTAQLNGQNISFATGARKTLNGDWYAPIDMVAAMFDKQFTYANGVAELKSVAGGDSEPVITHPAHQFFNSQMSGSPIYAQSYYDSVTGGSGNDRIVGIGGSHSLKGGAGDDWITGGDVVWGGAGSDQLDGSDRNDVIRGFENATFDGTDRWNWISGGKGNDTLYGGDWGNDFFYNRGDGTDTIQLAPTVQYYDDITFQNYNRADAKFTMSGSDLVITLPQAGDQVKVLGWANQTSSVYLVFADGIYDRAAVGRQMMKLEGTTGDDTLSAGTGTKEIKLYGYGGNDNLTGNDGNNLMDGGSGTDTLNGGAGNDGLYGGDGNDTLNGGLGDDGLFGGLNDDILDGGDGNDSLFGGMGVDQLYGNAGNDILSGDAGNDTLNGGAGNDTIEGGADNDLLIGGLGSNVYLFAPGSGNDRIQITAGSDDTLVISGGLIPEDINFSYSGNDLVISLRNSSDSVTVEGWKLGNKLTNIRFETGGTITQNEVETLVGTTHGTNGNDVMTTTSTSGSTLFGHGGNDRLQGGAGADMLSGGTGDDTLAGGVGSDILLGGAGADVIEFNLGDGKDTVVLSGKEDSLHLGAGIAVADLVGTFDSNGNFVLSIGSNGDQLLFEDWVAGNQLAFLELADGTVLTTVQIEKLTGILNGTSGDDILTAAKAMDYTINGGAGADTITGNSGKDSITGGTDNDSINGGTGADTYLFGLGDGQDTYTLAGVEDKLELGAGIALGDITGVINGSGDYVLTIGAGTDTLTFKNWNDGNKLASLKLADNTLLSTAQLEELAGALNGTDGDDILTVAKAMDYTISGGAGADTITGNSGKDSITGGTGNDNITGGTGVDTYLFGLGDGQDTYTLSGVEDKLELGSGIALGDLTGIINAGGDYVLTIGAGTDTLTFKNWNDGNKLASLKLDDNTLLSTTQLEELAGILNGTAGDDILTAEKAMDYTINGGAGADTITGNDGKDSIKGGTGNDSITGGTGADTYLFGLGDGQDTYTLAGVEDKLELGAGIALGDLSGAINGNGDYVLTIGAGGDTLTFTNWKVGNKLESLKVSDGGITLNTAQLEELAGIMNGTAGDDILAATKAIDYTINGGAGADIITGNSGKDSIIGGSGNDSIIGGAEADTYLFGLGDGQDSYTLTGIEDKLELGNGIALSDLTGAINASGDYVLTIGAGTDTLTFKNWNDGNKLSSLKLADDTLLNTAQLEELTGVINGTSGNDIIAATLAIDHIINGDAGADTITGNAAKDTIIGGVGNDTITGGAGTDTYQFNLGDGEDTYILQGADDILMLGSGVGIKDVKGIMNADGSYTLKVGSAGDGLTFMDWVAGNRLAELHLSDGTILNTVQIENLKYTNIDGTQNNDNLKGSSASTVNEWIRGFGGNDTLTGYSGDDVLDGGLGTDSLVGGLGNDTYVFNAGYGKDIINDTDATAGNLDKVVFGTGLNAADAQLSRTGNNLVISFIGSSDVLTVQNYYSNDTYKVERFEFADGTLWDKEIIDGMAVSLTGTEAINSLVGTNGTNVMQGLGGNDTLTGYSGDDVLDGGLGNDSLVGGLGNDTYIFNVGYGQDIINDTDVTAGNFDKVLFGAGLNAVDAQLSRTGNNLAIGFIGSSDLLTVRNYYTNDSYKVERFEFADGTLWDKGIIDGMAVSLTGTEANNSLVGTNGINVMQGLGGNDTLTGYNGDDVLDGGLGNDSLVGGLGNDTYIFNAGYGQDIINDTDVTAGNFDKVVFGAGLNAVDTQLSRSGNNLVIGFVGSSDLLTVQNYYSNDTYKVERFEFADGTLWDKGIIDGMAVSLTGTEAINSLVGTNGINVMQGLGGNDTLNGYSGNDSLDGGAGNDTLYGGAGNDQYIFTGTFGQDSIINNTSVASDYDSAYFGTDSSKLVFSKSSNDLKINVAGETDSVLVKNWYSGGLNVIDEIATQSGGHLVGTQVAQLIQAMATFTTQTGLTWEQAAQQNNQQYIELLATYYQQ